MPQRRTTICVLGARGMPNVSGGVEAHCEQLIPRLAARDPEARFILLARRPYCRGAARYAHQGVEVIAGYAPRHRYFEAAVHTLRAVFAARFSHGARACHIHAIGPGLFAPLARLLGMKVIFTHHSRNYLHVKWNALARAVLRLGEWSAVTFANRVIAVSPSMAEELRRRFPGKGRAITFIPNGATDFSAAGASDVLERLGLEAGNYVLAVGRLVPEKGFHDLVAAFEAARPGKRLVIAGKADFEDSYSKQLQGRASSAVLFAGQQDRAALAQLYKHAALFVLPSHHEGMPIAALEALSFNTPLLLSDIEANTDLELPAAHYFPKGDVAALADRLKQDFCAYAFDAGAMMSRYQWDAVAAQTGAVFDEVLGRPAPVLAAQR